MSTIRSELSNISMSLTNYICIFVQNAVAAHIHFGYSLFLCRFLYQQAHLMVKDYKSRLPVRTVEYLSLFLFHFHCSVLFKMLQFLTTKPLKLYVAREYMPLTPIQHVYQTGSLQLAGENLETHCVQLFCERYGSQPTLARLGLVK